MKDLLVGHVSTIEKLYPSKRMLMASETALQLHTQLQDGLAKYQVLFDSNMIGVASTDFSPDGVIMQANDAFLSMLGYTQQDVQEGKLKWSIISPDKYNEADDEKMKELMLNRRMVPFEKEYIHKDGHVVPVLVGAEMLGSDLSTGVCFALDISELKELEQRKDDFIGTVSHELKTPLSVMRLYSDFLKNSIQENASKEELMESVNEIASQIDKLALMVSDLLNMARYRTQQEVLSLSALEIGDLAKRIVSEISLVSNRDIIFQCEKAVYVKGNQARLSQVITNLVNNARRYSSADTDIIVKIFKTDSCGFIQVQDFGMGISKEDIPKIFEKHYRVNHADDYTDQGAGIGLYICREIIKQHKGTISVESTLGKGSTFTVELPLV